MMLLPNIGLVILVRIDQMLFCLPTPTNSCAIVTQRSNTPENVVCYLQKEANFTIVSNKALI